MKLSACLVLLVCAACSKSKPATSSTTPMTTGSTTGSTTDSTSSTTTTSDMGMGGSTVQPMDGAEACPNIQVKAPDSVPAGKQAMIVTTLVGGQGTPSFTWSLSRGTIASGQGTPHIMVDTAGLAGSTIVATVKLGGLKTECATNTATVSVLVGN